MFTIETVITALVTTLLGYVLWLEKRIHKMQSQVEDKISHKEAEHLIDLKQSVMDVRLKDLKEDIKEIKQDLKDIKNKL